MTLDIKKVLIEYIFWETQRRQDIDSTITGSFEAGIKEKSENSSVECIFRKNEYIIEM